MALNGDERQSAKLPSWPPPHGGYERILKLDRRAEPLPAWQIVFLRVLLILATAAVLAMLVAGPAWRTSAIGVAGGELGTLLGFLLVPGGRRWLLQVAGVRPPAKRDR